MKKLSYKTAGVDIGKGDALAAFAGKVAAGRKDPNVLAGVGGFGSLYRLPVAKGRKPPLLVAGTDSVGTKLKLAFRTGTHDTVGIDCVAMCANDVACQGAQPLFFLDYIGISRLDLTVAKDLVKGVKAGCDLAGCSLVGGETAELPGLYAKGEYDLCGFCVGGVDEHEVVDGSSVKPGDVVIGVGSDGLHSNGFSLVNRILDLKKPSLTRDIPELGCSLQEELLRPTRIYARQIRNLMRHVRVRALAHITGSGLPGKGPRQLPKGLGLELVRGSWPVLPVFRWLEREGRLSRAVLFDTFNMGLGLLVTVRRPDADLALKTLLDTGERAQVVGRIVKGRRFALIE